MPDPRNWTYQEHPDDIHARPLPWHDRVRADVAAAGGATTQTAVVPVTAAILRAHYWRLAAGEVLCTPVAGSGALRRFGPDLVRAFVSTHVAEWLRVRSDAEVAEVVDTVTATVVAEHTRARDARPAAEVDAERLDTAQRLADRRAEIEAQAARLAAELAALDDGAEPVAGVGPADQPRRAWRRNP